MCGRYRRTTQEEELARRYKIPIPAQTDLPISWNIAPSQEVLVIRYNGAKKQRSLDALRWGLIPSWAKDEKIAYSTINARVETVDTAPSFRGAFLKRRCLIPADGFYEWRKSGGPKLPYSIEMKNNQPFVFAGLWEGWKAPGTENWLRTCTIITTEANELLSQIHNRMPVILPEEHHAEWLGETEVQDLKALLRPFPAEEMKMQEISSRVNSPKNNDPEVIGLPEILPLHLPFPVSPQRANEKGAAPADYEFLREIYRGFNARDVEQVLAAMHPDVEWANGMEGGYVHGRNAVRDYWTRQWQLIDPRVDPQRFEGDARQVVVEVHQVVRDLSGSIQSEQMVRHQFLFEEGLIKTFRILDGNSKS